MKPLEQIVDQIWQVYSGEAAWQTVSDLSRFHRIQASPGYRRAADLIHQRLLHDGLQAEILSYPADEGTHFWAWPSFQEWVCSAATLHLVEPREQAGPLADYRACPISLIQRSAAFDGEAEVVALEKGEEEADYEGLEVAGKVVLTNGDVRRVWELAVARRGAIGILFDGMRYAEPVRPEGDLADARQYTSFWWQAGDVPCFGFVLTPRQGRRLRRLLKGNGSPARGEPAETVRVRTRVESRMYDGALEVVSATIPGGAEKEVVVTAHLCHPQPSANDNASGAAAALETARALHTLIAEGTLVPPRRTIRFLWLPEMTGTFAYLAAHEAELDRLVAGLNLDMVGQDQGQTGSSWLLERPPESAASFAPVLLARLRDELLSLKGMTDVSPSLSGLGGYPLFRHAEVPFSGGSDHWILSDPSVGVPTPMLIQWPDRFYHTSADTPDRTDPHSLARAGTLAAAYAYWLASAGVDEATWLGYEMAARLKARAAQTAQATVTHALAQDEGQALAQSLVDLDRRLAFLLDCHQAALQTLARLGPVECLFPDLLAEAERVTQHELSWASGAVDLYAATQGLAPLPDACSEPPASRSPEEQAAAGLVPVRLLRGPVPLHNYLRRLDDEERETWRQLLKARKGGTHRTLTALALFWADGRRSVLEIADLVELETGQRDVELLLAYFRLLEELGLVSW
jgi:aminopeptidase YwaD